MSFNVFGVTGTAPTLPSRIAVRDPRTPC